MSPDHVTPRYGIGSLAEVMPSAAALLEVPGYADVLGLGAGVSAPRAVVVLLVDGLGLRQLSERAGHAPFLRALLQADPDGLTAGFPTTTASSLATLGVGMPPGQHGVMGYDVLDPASGRVVNQLTWPDDLDPEVWQPQRTVFEQAVTAGVDVVRIGPKAFGDSGLTCSALRGGRYVAAQTLPERMSAALDVVGRSPRLLGYVYWGELDKIGHEKGWESLAWTRALEDLDAAVAALSSRLPAGVLLVVTADHGMVDIPASMRIDMAGRPDLQRGVRISAGEPRAVYLWPDEGRHAAVAERWQDGLGDVVEVLTRDTVVAAGWFGPDPRPDALARVGELIVVARGGIAVVDTRRHRPDQVNLIGWHGGLSVDEALIPLLRHIR